MGRLEKPVAMQMLLARLRKVCGVGRVLLAGPGRPKSKPLRTLAVCAGSGHAFLKDAIASGADIYVTGELRHHDALAASAAGLTVACVGHSNSERLALPTLASQMRESLPALDVAISQADRDPFEIV